MKQQMPPIVSIVGRGKTGKTTLIEKLVGELKSRGYRVATIKHTPRGAGFDEPGKDSWRHIQAGSEATAIASPDKLVLIRPTTQTLTLDGIARFFGEDYDIILTEGFKQESAPKIEVHRRKAGPPLSAVRKLIAIATDEPLETKARQFPLEDIQGLADLIENGFLKPKRELFSVYINHTPLPLSSFPREIITNTLLALLSSLKGVEKIKSLEIFLRKKANPK